MVQTGLNRWRYEEQKARFFAVDTAVVLAVGDCGFQDTDDFKPAASFTWDTNIATTRLAFMKKFAGVSDARSLAGEVKPVKVNSNGIHEFICASATFEIGDLVGLAKHASADTILNNTVIAVTNPEEAIGTVAEREGSAVTTVFVDVFAVVGSNPALDNKNKTVLYNAFQYPLPATDWTPEADGAGLAASLTAKSCFLPLSGLKIGDNIISYKLMGRVESAANAVTVDAKLVKTLNDGTNSDVAGGGITQVAKTANYTMDEEAVLTAPEIVAADYQYHILITGTTGASTLIAAGGVEVVVG